MKYLKSFESVVPVNGESKKFRNQSLPHKGEPIEKDGKISIFQQDWFEKLLPDTLKIVSDQKSKKLNSDQTISDSESKTEFTFDKNECTIDSDLVQFSYYYNSMRQDGGEVSDGEPNMLEFDIHFHKNDHGIKLLVDITYGDNMAVEFSIESPNKINVIHYTGYGAKYDSETHWGFKDESIQHLVNFFNAFSHGIKLQPKDLSFIDEHLDSYQHEVDNKDHYYTDDSDLVKFGNSMKDSEPTIKHIKSFESWSKS
jgi:hypothetical protein